VQNSLNLAYNRQLYCARQFNIGIQNTTVRDAPEAVDQLEGFHFQKQSPLQTLGTLKTRREDFLIRWMFPRASPVDRFGTLRRVQRDQINLSVADLYPQEKNANTSFDNWNHIWLSQRATVHRAEQNSEYLGYSLPPSQMFR
jgi:hypothetical protein